MLTEQEKQLFEAATEGKIDKVKKLIGKGADVKAKDEFENTALHCAVINGHVEVVKYLTEKGADINAVDKDGWTALRSAVQNNYNNLELIKTLLECEDIDVDIPDNNGLTPLRIAVNCNHKEASQLIIRHLVEKNKDKPDDLKGEYSVYWKECEDELRDMKEYKLDNSVSLFDILTTNDKRKLELYVRNENIVEVLRSNVNSIKEKFPIYAGQIGKQCKKGLERKYAVEKIVDCISRKELDPNEFRLKDLNEYALRKLLEYAINITLEDDKNLLKDLVPPRSNFSTKSVEVGQRSGVQCSILPDDIKRHEMELAKLLIASGADVNIENNEGKTPLDVARKEGKTEIANILRNQPDGNFSITSVEVGQRSGVQCSIL